MPFKPKKPCTYPGCPNLTNGGRCPEHKDKAKEAYDATRGNSGERGYDAAWQEVREIKVAQDPLCEECTRQGHDKELDVVHHIKPVKTHPELRLDMENLQSLCTEHHEAVHKGERWGR